MRRNLGSLRRRFVALGSVLGAGTLWSPTAAATFSVILTNTRTGELGGAVTSCVGDFDLQAIFGITRTPSGQNVGSFTQAWFSDDNHRRVQELLLAGGELDEVLSQVTALTFDPDQAERQYHFLRSDGVGVTWTGDKTGAFAGGIKGTFDEWSFTAAGNILTSEVVLTTIEQSLRSSQGAIEQRLVATLEAVEAVHEGDSRCTPLPGDSAFIGVSDGGGVRRVWSSVTNTAPRSAVVQLRALVGFEEVNEATPDAAVSMPPGSPPASKETTCASAGPRPGRGWAWVFCLIAATMIWRFCSNRKLPGFGLGPAQ